MTGAEELESWTPLWAVLGVYVVIAVAVSVAGARSGRSRTPLTWPADGLERVTGMPGWAPAMIGTAAIGLLTAGIGFYSDVAWHIGLGRDEELFTAPHTMIVVGLGIITVAAGLGIFFATLTRADTALRWGGLRIPWSAVPLGVLGGCALAGFPLDEIWHQQYGVDVTMWSPTHLLMICGASLSLVAAWLVLAEAGVRTGGRIWGRVAHLIAGFFVLAGLSSVQGEFAFGVPQFQQLYHPVLVTLAAGFALVACRVVMGPGRALAVAVLSLGLELIGRGDSTELVSQRAGAVYVVSAIAVELVAVLIGTQPRWRFALASGVGVATLGLAGEWRWNQGAPQPWTASLLPEALFLSVLVGAGAAVLGAAWGGAIARDGARMPAALVGAGAVAVVLALAIPLPRTTSPVTASVELQRRGDLARVSVELQPADAADDVRWFQLSAWQGGGLVLADMREESPGRWVGERAVPVTGDWKTLLRLHRGSDMMAVPIFLPADEEIGAPEIPAVDRTMPFENEQRYLLREVKDGPATYELIVYAILFVIALAWATTFTLAAVRIRDRATPATTPRDRVSSRA